MDNSDHNYLLIDSTKMDMRGFYKFKTINSFDAVICNNFSTELSLPDNFILVKNMV